MSVTTLYNIATMSLAILACVWMVWSLKWVGLYIVFTIVMAALLQSWSERHEVNKLIVVGGFLLVSFAVSRVVFRRK